jgi:hypothetical protein
MLLLVLHYLEIVVLKCSLKLKDFFGPGMIAHICNPNYSVGRDKEDRGLRPAMQKVSETTFQPVTGGGDALPVIPAPQEA